MSISPSSSFSLFGLHRIDTTKMENVRYMDSLVSQGLRSEGATTTDMLMKSSLIFSARLPTAIQQTAATITTY